MRAAATLGLALAALACSAAASAATHDPRAPQKRTSAADTKRASSIALVRSDFVAGWTQAPKQPDPPPCTSEPDESSLVETAHLDRTFLFRDGITQIGSDVAAFATVGQARTDWRLSTLKATRSCLIQTLHHEFGKGVAIVVRSAVSLPSPNVGERTLHYRLIFDLEGKRTVRGVTELLGVGAGRISVVLHSFSLGTPLPASALDALTGVLARRLVSSSGGA